MKENLHHSQGPLVSPISTHSNTDESKKKSNELSVMENTKCHSLYVWSHLKSNNR